MVNDVVPDGPATVRTTSPAAVVVVGPAVVVDVPGIPVVELKRVVEPVPPWPLVAAEPPAIPPGVVAALEASPAIPGLLGAVVAVTTWGVLVDTLRGVPAAVSTDVVVPSGPAPQPAQRTSTATRASAAKPTTTHPHADDAFDRRFM